MYIPLYFLIFSFNMIFYKTKILLVIYFYIYFLYDSNIDASLCSHAGACLYERFHVILTMALKQRQQNAGL